ncbi:MAG: S8 family serine peptidase [Bacteroidota bacterium]
MLSITYIISFLAIILGLLLWTSFNSEKTERFFRGITVVAILAFLGSWLAQVAPVEYKLEVLVRDLLVIAASGAVFTFVARKRKLFLLLLAITIAGGYWYLKNELGDRFPFKMADTNGLSIEGEYLVELTPNRSTAEMDQLKSWAEKNKVQYEWAFTDIQDEESTDLDDYLLVNTPNDVKSDLLMNDLKAFPFVEYVEANEVIQLSPIETQKQDKITKRERPDFRLNDPGVDQLWSFPAMQMDKLYEFLEVNEVKPKKKALVAILDTGVDSKHEDLKDNFKSIHKKSNDDPKGHGTHCAGIAGAVSNNGKGVASYSRDNFYVQITSYKVLGKMGYGTQQSIINGITKAADAGADVISLSLGGPSNDSRQKAYSQAVKYANQKGAIVVAAAGNSNSNSKNYSPVNADGIIGVSAVDKDLNRASFSNFVQDIEMGIAAPGVGIYSTIPGSQYATYNGTSMATPYVAGLLGLLKSIDPSLDTETAYKILKETGAPTQSTRETGPFILPPLAVRALLNSK